MFRVFRLRRSEEGQSLVEFALLLPLLLFLLMGIIQFGLVLSGYVTVSNAAREGARVGIIEKTNSAITTKVNQAFDASATLTTPVVNVTFPEGGPGGTFENGKPVSVQVTGTVDIIVPLLEAVFPGNSIEISRTSVMMVEGYDSSSP